MMQSYFETSFLLPEDVSLQGCRTLENDLDNLLFYYYKIHPFPMVNYYLQNERKNHHTLYNLPGNI